MEREYSVAARGLIGMLAACVLAACLATLCMPARAVAAKAADRAGIGAALASVQIQLIALDIQEADVEAPAVRMCTSRPLRPRVRLSYHGITLKRGVDYTVSYSNNKMPGIGKITISGKGAFKGTIQRSFKIKGKYKPLVLVADKSLFSASETRIWLRQCGFRTAFTKTAKANPKNYDGLVIPGGTDDVHPSLYGEKKHGAYHPKKWLDKMQFKLIHKFANANKPVLGICRGNQVINVAYGGSLIQNLPGGYHTHDHSTEVKKGTWLYKIFGKRYTTWHYHHQAVKRPGKGLIVSQRDKKRKIVEAIEHKTLPVWGLQFHPEHMGKAGKKIANKFKRECIKRMR